MIYLLRIVTIRIMYILTVKGKESEGAYAPIFNRQSILYLFTNQDDAERHSILLAAEDYPEMTVVEVEDDVALHICKQNNYSYCIVTPDDIIIPPYQDD